MLVNTTNNIHVIDGGCSGNLLTRVHNMHMHIMNSCFIIHDLLIATSVAHKICIMTSTLLH